MTERSALPDDLDMPSYGGGSTAAGGLLPSLLLFKTAMASLNLLVRRGRVQLQYRDLWNRTLGDSEGPHYKMQIDSLRLFPSLLANAELGFGESYMNGYWHLQDEDLAGLIGLLLQNHEEFQNRAAIKLANACRNAIVAKHRQNTPVSSRKNVAHHYDIGNDLYEAFLDEGMNYSCAFFENPDQGLREAQLNKLRTSIERLRVDSGTAVIDIGCGWGELTRKISCETDAAHVMGITLAEQQYKFACEQVPAGLGNRLSYQLEDYRIHGDIHAGQYDRAISVGMFEHVGRRHFSEFFATVRRLLKSDGRALVHTIIRPRPDTTIPFIDKYIFPGGYIPTLDEVLGGAAQGGIVPDKDPYIHEGTNYARTLQLWRQRFNDAIQSLDQIKYGARFCRMWNFYLAASEAAFSATGFSVAQVYFRKN